MPLQYFLTEYLEACEQSRKEAKQQEARQKLAMQAAKRRR